MIKYLKIVIFIALFVILSLNSAYGESTALEEISSICNDISYIEKKYGSDEWGEALTLTDNLLVKYDILIPELKEKDVKDGIIKTFSNNLENLKQSLTNKDIGTSRKYSMALHTIIMKIMDIYEYKIPHSLTMIDDSITNVEESLKAADFAMIENTMDEIGMFFNKAELLRKLKEKGAVSEDIKEFQSKVKIVKEAGATQDIDIAKAGVGELRVLSDKFIALF